MAALAGGHLPILDQRGEGSSPPRPPHHHSP